MTEDSPVLPDRLFHYTRGSGLLGIVDSEHIGLHATSTLHMNDSREAIEASRHIHHAARHWRDHFDAFRQQLIDQEFPEEPPVPESLPRDVREIFTVSFTEAGDLLSQWRAYTQPGDGYALAFSAAAIQEHFQSIAASTASLDDVYSLAKCHYFDPKNEFTRTDPVSRAIFSWLNEEGEDPSYKSLHYDRDSLSAIVKHIAFEEEQEWRLVPGIYTKCIPDILCFKSGSFSIKPFTKFTFPKQVLTGVCVGPGPYQALAKRAVEQMLSKRGYANVEVTCSNAPLRRS